MPFDLAFPALDTSITPLQLETGQMLFVLGANGTGKSSLMQRFAQQNGDRTRKISAHRQTWMNTDTMDLTPSAKLQVERAIRNEDRNIQSRYRDGHAAQRASMTVYELINAENIRARAIAAAIDADDVDAAKEAARAEAPITVINELLRQSNIPVTILIRENEQVMASKDGGPEYSAAQLSDGERNALLVAGNVLTAPPESLLIIDEPERHLHRSIISPLLSQLFERRRDCACVISTHDHDLPLELPSAKTLLLRSCQFDGQNARGWEADELPADSPIDDVLRRDLLGARRKVLFVEGTESSLDKPLYSLIFPTVSVIPKGTCRDVEHAVVGSRAGEGFHWLSAFGIADGDGFSQEQIEAKRGMGVYALPYYSVEAVYFHPQIIAWIAERQANVTGDDATGLAQGALASGIAAIADHTERLSRKIAKKAVRKQIEGQLPNDNELLAGAEVVVSNNGPQIHATRKAELDAAVQSDDWEAILTRCPIRESAAPNEIARSLRFQNIEDYQKAVRHLLTEEDGALAFVRDLFDDLYEQLNE